jgi:diadenosine tetraphosphate (Ap4A) HIT family hydrolase
VIRDCPICERISLIKKGKNPHFVKEMESGYLVLGDHQFYKGYSVLLCKNHVSELYQLDNDIRRKFLWEMSIVAEAVFRTFKPKKINYELLGNTDSHVHWHIFPRYHDDPLPGVPTWCLDKKIRKSDSALPSQEELDNLKEKLLRGLQLVMKKE